MNNLAEKRRYSQATQEYGQVVGREASMFIVETEIGQYRVQRAVSCVVRPEIDDLVLVSICDTGQGHLLAVLERDPGLKTTLSFDTDVDIKAEDGRVGITAGNGLDLSSSNDINLLSANLGVTAAEGKVNIRRLSFWGAFWEGSVDAVKVISETFESFVQRFNRSARYSYRRVEELDQLHCGRLHYKAEGALQMRGEFSQITAEEDVYINGERINIG